MNKIRYFGLLVAALLIGISEAVAQNAILTGQVTEYFNGQKEPIMGANVVVVNKGNRYLGGAITDMDGNYSIPVPKNEKNLTIRFSYIGLRTQNIPYKGQTTLNVTLESDAEQLQDVEVVAKRIERDAMGVSFLEQTAATQKVMMDELVETTPVTSVEEALQGQLAGVDITLGGDPGARSAIRIRGVNSLNSSNEPLIVLDGVPYPTDISDDFEFATANEEDFGALLNISPSDIESIEVLKDASATAIWGTQGANGVLMITTKKGTKGKTRFQFNSKTSAKFEPASIPLLSGKQYVAMMQDAIWNAANSKGLSFAAAELDLLYNTYEIGYDPAWTYFDEYNVNVNWLDLVRKDAYTFDNSISMSGGGDKATYRFSLGYVDEMGTTIGTNMDRFNAKLNIGYNFSDRLRVSTDFSFTQTNRDANVADVRSEAMRAMPNKSPYWIDDETGEYRPVYFAREDYTGAAFDNDKWEKAKHFNALAMAEEGYNRTLVREEKANLEWEYKFPFKLTYKGYVSLNMKTTKNRQFLPQVATGLLWTDPDANASIDNMSDALTLQTSNTFTYINTFAEKHQIIGTYVFRTVQSTSSSYSSKTSGNASSNISDPTAGGSVADLNSGKSESRSVSSIFQLVYMFDRRYALKATLNTEGNSAMGKKERFGNFPSFGLTWNISEEPFLEKANWLSDTKLRVGYGWSGRAPSGSSYYLGAYQSLGAYGNMSAISPVRMQLDNLKWESTRELNIGLDIRLFDRFSATVDYYYKYSSDLLQEKVAIPTVTGFDQLRWYNSGEMSNRGIEVRFDYEVFKNKDWRVTAFMNASRNINKVEKLPINMNQENYERENGSYAVRVVEGDPIGSFYGYRYKGVFQNVEDTYARDAEGEIMHNYKGEPIIMKNIDTQCFPGDAKYEDVNHDGVINESDIVYLGNSNPLLLGGFGFSVKYKNVQLNTNFYGRYGQKVINAARMDLEGMRGTDNQSTAVLNRWRAEGDDTDIPRALYGMGYNYLGSDRFVEDASFLRLKTITLSWDMPKTWLKRVGINNLKLFCTGYDLLTWTDYSGQDPEVSVSPKATEPVKDSNRTPVSKRVTFGLNLSF
ncbi:MAG: SusC/RagA family TonB-linked outer membrane protein [Bacteroidaceae bacterium]|nr:SusC/RagA family TonB-linked outer membrane protein [Bacteroidaceae bacterium]